MSAHSINSFMISITTDPHAGHRFKCDAQFDIEYHQSDRSSHLPRISAGIGWSNFMVLLNCRVVECSFLKLRHLIP